MIAIEATAENLAHLGETWLYLDNWEELCRKLVFNRPHLTPDHFGWAKDCGSREVYYAGPWANPSWPRFSDSHEPVTVANMAWAAHGAIWNDGRPDVLRGQCSAWPWGCTEPAWWDVEES